MEINDFGDVLPIDSLDKINHNDDKYLKDLRDLRQKFTDLGYEIQKKIDEYILSKNHFNQYLHKYITTEDSGTVYLYVKRITRLTSGCRLWGAGYKYDGNYFLTIFNEYDIELNLSNSNDKVKIISEEEFYSNLEKEYNNQVQLLENFSKND